MACKHADTHTYRIFQLLFEIELCPYYVRWHSLRGLIIVSHRYFDDDENEGISIWNSIKLGKRF